MKQRFLLSFTAAFVSICLWADGYRAIHNTSFAEVQNPSSSQWSVLSSIKPDLISFLLKAVAIDRTSGAIGRNRDGFKSVGFQRYSSRFITYGILTKNTELIDLGIRSIEYPLSFQQADGSLSDYSSNNGKSSATSVAFYLHDVGHSLLLCQNSQWFQQSNETAFFRTRLKQLQPRTSQALAWLIEQEQQLIKGDGKGRATNRLWIDANAYYLTGTALNNENAVSLGKKFAALSLEQQNSEGAFLEKGGFDSSYQGVSLQQALLFYTNLSDRDSLRPLLWDAIQRAAKLELNYILPNGEVTTTKNTRVTTVGGETYFGKTKNVDYLALIQALNYYYQLTQDPDIKDAADRLLTFYRSQRR